jgi:hypothetical protein
MKQSWSDLRKSSCPIDVPALNQSASCTLFLQGTRTILFNPAQAQKGRCEMQIEDRSRYRINKKPARGKEEKDTMYKRTYTRK